MGAKPTTDSPRQSPAERPVADRLRDALAEMIRQQASGNALQTLTATTLCQLAAVSRNALYRYHPDVLHALHKAQRQYRCAPDPAMHVVRQVRGENDALREQVAVLDRPDACSQYVSRGAVDRHGDLFFGHVGPKPVGLFRVTLPAERKKQLPPVRIWG